MTCRSLPLVAPPHLDLDAAIVVALGANLRGASASPIGSVEKALVRMEAAGLRVIARSSWWRSAAWPDPSQPDYINAVALVDTALAPAALLATLHGIEQACGRERGERNAARVLDLDLIAHGRIVTSTPSLVLPHPRAAERLFVMGPLAQIAPAWRWPPAGRAASELALAATVGMDATPLAGPGAGG